MLRHRLFGLAIAGLLLLTNVPRASATDGHFLHGVGAINSAMGGARTLAARRSPLARRGFRGRPARAGLSRRRG